MNHILLIDKPSGWTSFDVVARIRGQIRKKFEYRNSKLEIKFSKKIKVGHAGTLDPFATGLLIVLVGEATKKQAEFMKLDKEYVADIMLGATSSTGDPEGEITKTSAPNKIPDVPEVKKAVFEFTGEIEQVPPSFSAIKVNGKRAYKLARTGEKPELKARKIIIYNLEIMDYKYPNLKLKVNCSSGTYIRTLAEDIGKSLGVGGYLKALKRTKIGKYELKNATKIEDAVSNLKDTI